NPAAAISRCGANPGSDRTSAAMVCAHRFAARPHTDWLSPWTTAKYSRNFGPKPAWVTSISDPVAGSAIWTFPKFAPVSAKAPARTCGSSELSPGDNAEVFRQVVQPPHRV